MNFDELCIREMVRKDAFATMLFIMKSPKNQQPTFKKWFINEVKRKK